jgi:CRISPR-associated protein (TIGR03986 family)
VADHSGQLQWRSESDTLYVVPDGPGNARTVKRNRMLVPELRTLANADLHGLRVDYGWRNGQPDGIRRQGQAAPERPTRPTRSSRQPVSSEEFVNPYLFIPARPRPRVGRGGDLDDRRPDGHHRVRQDRWSGRIAVTLTVNTPLLLLDTARAQRADEKGHATYPVLMRDGSPHLAATSVKGTLRAAYEAVTNSRFGVFTGHRDRLGYRMTTRDGLGMVPARISDDGREVVLLPGDTPIGRQGDHGFPLHAAWLPQYTAKRPTPANHSGRRRYPDGRLPVHGHEVEAEVELREHPKKGFLYWSVRHVNRIDHHTGTPLPASADRPPATGTAPVPGSRKTIRGWVFISNQNVGNKHDERLFFTGSQHEVRHPLTDPLRAEWENLIRDYRAANRRSDVHERRTGAPGSDLAPPQQFLGDKPGKTAWSPHQYDDTYLRLVPGSLCYATVDDHGQVTGLYPVAIARALFTNPPENLLDATLRPAPSLDELSPADRVFGWVADSGSGGGAYRGQLRVGPVTCETDTSHAVEEFSEPGVPLAVLSMPNPQQGRFYVAADKNAPHRPLAGGKPKADWFTAGQGPRGRKAYWHHAHLPDGYWDKPTQDRTQDRTPEGRYQEYRRPDGERVRDDQNRSVLGWIRPDTVFRFTLDIDNLTDTELGALTWLLTLPDNHFHRLGHGKPLGFGSARLDLDPAGTDLRTGDHWRDYYRTLAPESDAQRQRPETELPAALCRRLAQAFEADTRKASRDGSDPALDTFLAAARGPDGFAVHYPRTRPKDDPGTQAPPPDPEGRSYAWFTANERQGGGRQARSLPAWHTPQLPYYQDGTGQNPTRPPQPHPGRGPRPQGRQR